MKQSTWEFTKPTFGTDRTMVAAKVPAAAAAGASVFERGGNAVDAAVATAFASGVAEPYMSGLGGGGFMLIRLASEQRTIAIDFSMLAPISASPGMFELDPSGGHDDFFGWRRVRDAANVDGYRSIGVPGTVAGLALANARYGRLPLRDVMAPAIEMARDGFEVSWFDTLMIAQHQDLLDRFEWTRQTFLPKSRVLVSTPSESPRIIQRHLAETLEAIAESGADEFYRGGIATALTRNIQENGGLLSLDDMAAYEVRVTEAAPTARYRDVEIAIPHGICGSTTVLETLRILDGFDVRSGGHNTPATLDLVAQASRLAFADRYGLLGEMTEQDDGGLGLLTDDFIESRRAVIDPGHADLGQLSAPGLGAPTSPTAAGLGGSTTHMSAADSEGNLVTLTQTLLQLFGSGVVAGDTGVLMNNAMAWFDPVPGNSASAAPRKRALTNMSPILVADQDGPRMALGASGGRKIMQAVLQIVLNTVDHGLGMQDAVAAPRIDCSGPETLVNSRIDSQTADALQGLGHPVSVVHDSFTARRFASPACIRVDPTDERRYAGLDPFYPATAAGH